MQSNVRGELNIMIRTATLDTTITANLGHKIEYFDKNNRSLSTAASEDDTEKIAENTLRGN